MTIVIPFSPTRVTLRRKAESARSASAEAARTDAGASPRSAAILFFTGVRYERQAEPAIEAAPRQRRPASASRRALRKALAGQTL